jgi:hypothetical protein
MRKNIVLYIIPLFLLAGVIGVSSTRDFGVVDNNKVDLHTNPIGATNATEDIYEENDVSGDATPITGGLYEDLAANDNDWYSIDVEGGGTLTITAWFDEWDDLDINICGVRGGEMVYLSRSATYDNPESCSFMPSENETLYIYVSTAYKNSSVVNWYDLEILNFPAALDDPYEYNDMQANATAMTAGTYDAVCLNNDWYSVDLTANHTLSTVITFDSDECDLDIVIVDSDGKILTGSFGHGNDNETASFDALADGTYYIKVVPFHAADTYVADGDDFIQNVGLNYELIITITETPAAEPEPEPEAEGGIPGYAPFFLALSVVSTLGILIYRKRK